MPGGMRMLIRSNNIDARMHDLEFFLAIPAKGNTVVYARPRTKLLSLAIDRHTANWT